jgi:hypothetical protein
MPGETRPIRFLDHLPRVFQNDDSLLVTVRSTAGTVVNVEPFAAGPAGFPAGTPVEALKAGARTTLAGPIAAGSVVATQILVRDSAFTAAIGPGEPLRIKRALPRLLDTFENLFEEIEAAIEGTAALQAGDAVIVHQGGLPDLFGVATTPPPELQHRPQPDFDYLGYLASWIGLPLRPEKPVDWNRRFFAAALLLYSQRSTVPGLDALIRAWLKDDLLETVAPSLILTDLTRVYNDVDALFQLTPANPQDARPEEVYAQLGLNTSLGEGAPFFFIADLITDPAVRDLRNPAGLDVFERAARYLLDVEKPAYTHYELRVRGQTMQLAPASAADARPGEIYAQFEDTNPGNPLTGTTLLWDAPDVFESDQ